MGMSFTNIEVLVGDRTVAEVWEAVADVFRARMRTQGFSEVEGTQPDDGREERSVYFVWEEGWRWLSVLDEESEFGSDEKLYELLEEVTAATGGSAVGVRVIEDGIIEMFLYRAGAKVDWYSSEPDHIYNLGGKHRRKKDYVGKPELWRDILVGDATEEVLRAVWDSRPLLTYEMLKPLAPMFGGEAGWGWGGWQDGEYDRRQASFEGRAPRFARMVFRAEQPTPAPRATDGPPVLTVVSGAMGGDASIGYPLDQLLVTVANGGGVGQGLGIVVNGSAIDAGLIEPTAISVARYAHGEFGPSLQQKVESSLQPGQSNGVTTRYARLPEFALPARLVPATGEVPAVSWIGERTNDFINLTVSGEARRAGAGELWLGVIPTDHPAGRTDWRFAIQVSEPPRRPLRAAPNVHPATLRGLLPSSKLSGLIALGRDRVTLAPLVAVACERWWKIVAANDRRQCSAVLRRGPNLKPEVLRCQARHLLRQHRWPEWRESLASCESLHASVDYAMPMFGFEAPTNQIRPLPADAELVSYLCFGCDLAGRDADEQGRIIAALTAILDRLMADGAGSQALVARWESPLLAHKVATAYEAACDIHTEFDLRDWVTRYLRGVSERLWLGPNLLAYLRDVAQVEAVASVTPVGGGVRIVLADDADLDALERVLGSILPTPEEAWAAHERVWSHVRPTPSPTDTQVM